MKEPKSKRKRTGAKKSAQQAGLLNPSLQPPLDSLLFEQDTFSLNESWTHPLLKHDADQQPLDETNLDLMAEFYFCKFLPFFSNQKEGSIQSEVKIEFSGRMAQKLGLSYLFERIIRLNKAYFASNPSLLPYTLFHEMTHLWLYDCNYDPNHTQRFYDKMEHFSLSGLPTDGQVHIHKRITKEANHIYACPNCANRWYLKKELSYPIYCGLCYDKDGIEYYASLKINSKGCSYY